MCLEGVGAFKSCFGFQVSCVVVKPQVKKKWERGKKGENENKKERRKKGRRTKKKEERGGKGGEEKIWKKETEEGKRN